MEKKKMITHNNSDKAVNWVKKTMELSGMPLTDNIVKNLYAITSGETTAEEECQKVINKYRKNNLNNKK